MIISCLKGGCDGGGGSVVVDYCCRCSVAALQQQVRGSAACSQLPQVSVSLQLSTVQLKPGYGTARDVHPWPARFFTSSTFDF